MAETSSLTSILNTIKGKLDSALADSNNHSEFTNNINAIEELIKKDTAKIRMINTFHNLLLLNCSEYIFVCLLRRESFIF